MLRTVVFAVLGYVALASAALAGEVNLAAADGAVLRVDWQGPEQLPPRFRNHCTLENFTGRPYCSDHCGIDSQFYYCSQASFGCCRLGHGYCDWNGVLRCHP
jgi:hypothetical protein